MFNIDIYLNKLLYLLKDAYDSRLLYVGLQGSYLRGEANEHSDIDIMVVIAELSVSDLDHYRAIIQSLDNYDKSCGFICSKKDLANWNPLEICNLLHSTKDYFGCLQDLIPEYTTEDIRNFIKLSLNNLYHEICHRYIHAEPARNIAHLPYTYKSVFFILQNLYYLRHGLFIGRNADLLNLLSGKDYEVLRCAIDLNNGLSVNFQDSFTLLFTWCQETLQLL